MSNGTSMFARWSAMQATIGFGALCGFFANQAMWFYIAINVPEAKDISPGVLAILNQLTGTTGALAGMVVGFYFGSSKGSQDKDDTTRIATQAAASAASATSATLDKVVGTGNGSPGGTKVVVTPPTPGVTTVETKDTEAPAPHAKRGSKRED